MNAQHFQELPAQVKQEFQKAYEPVEYTGKQLKKLLSDDEKITMFERRKTALAPQRKK